MQPWIENEMKVVITLLFSCGFHSKNPNPADLFSPGNSSACMKPKTSWEKNQKTQRYFEN